MKTIATKTVTLIQIAILTFCVGGCSKSPKDAIESVLNQCAQNSQKVNNSNMSAAQTAQFLASEMQKMDTSNCPSDFRTAFQQHINAWRDASGYFAQNTPLNTFLEGFAAGFLQDSSLYGVSQQNAAIAVQNINTTYNQLVTIAVAHGATVPESIIR